MSAGNRAGDPNPISEDVRETFNNLAHEFSGLSEPIRWVLKFSPQIKGESTWIRRIKMDAILCIRSKDIASVLFPLSAN